MDAIENHWIPKSLRFTPPGYHPIFKLASKHCMRARISICHNQIRRLNGTLEETKQKFSTLVTEDISSTLLQFLRKRSQSVRTSIEARRANKFANLLLLIRKVINLSQKLLFPTERCLLEKGPKFAPTPHHTTPHQLKISSLRSKQLSSISPMTLRTPYEPPLRPSSTELDHHHTATSPKQNVKH